MLATVAYPCRSSPDRVAALSGTFNYALIGDSAEGGMKAIDLGYFKVAVLEVVAAKHFVDWSNSQKNMADLRHKLGYFEVLKNLPCCERARNQLNALSLFLSAYSLF